LCTLHPAPFFPLEKKYLILASKIVPRNVLWLTMDLTLLNEDVKF
jgi:hypothetical protein